VLREPPAFESVPAWQLGVVRGTKLFIDRVHGSALLILWPLLALNIERVRDKREALPHRDIENPGGAGASGRQPAGLGAGTKLESAMNVPFRISYPLRSAILIGATGRGGGVGGGRRVGRGLGVTLGVGVGVTLGEGLVVGEEVAVGVTVGIGVTLGVIVGVAVTAGVAVAVGVAVGVTAGVGVTPGVGVDVGAIVGVGVGVDVPPGTVKAYTLLSPAT
jgi:hypothetical protein